MGTIKCDWCDRYFNHNCKDCRELNTHIRQLKSDLRKLVEKIHRNEPAQMDNVLNHAIHNGRIEVVRMIEKLLDGVSDGMDLE